MALSYYSLKKYPGSVVAIVWACEEGKTTKGLGEFFAGDETILYLDCGGYTNVSVKSHRTGHQQE